MVLSLLFFAGMFLTLPEREGKRKGRFGTMKMLAVIGVLTGACLLFSVSAHAETVCEGNTENISQTILYEAVEKREILPETARISVKNPQVKQKREFFRRSAENMAMSAGRRILNWSFLF